MFRFRGDVVAGKSRLKLPLPSALKRPSTLNGVPSGPVTPGKKAPVPVTPVPIPLLGRPLPPVEVNMPSPTTPKFPDREALLHALNWEVRTSVSTPPVAVGPVTTRSISLAVALSTISPSRVTLDDVPPGNGSLSLTVIPQSGVTVYV